MSILSSTSRSTRDSTIAITSGTIIAIVWIGMVFAISIIPRSIDSRWLSGPFAFKMGLSLSILASGFLFVLFLVIRRRRWFKTPIDLPVFLLIELVALQVLWATLNPSGVHHWMAGITPFWSLWVFFVPIGSYWLLSQIRLTDPTFRWLVIGIILFGAIHAIIGYTMALFPQFFPSIVELQWNRSSFLRMESPLGTGTLAMMLMMILPINVAALQAASHKRENLLLFINLLLLVSALSLTASRGPIIIGLLCSLITFILINRTRHSNQRISTVLRLVLALLVIALGIFVVNNYISTRTDLSLEQIIRLGHEADQSRIQKASYALGRFFESPVLGIGWGAVPIRSNTRIIDAIWENIGGDPHGLYYTVLAELGIAGILLFLLLFYRVLRPGFHYIRIRQANPNRRYVLAIGLTMSAVAMIMESLVTSQLLYNPKTAAMFWIVAGLLLTCYRYDITTKFYPRQ